MANRTHKGPKYQIIDDFKFPLKFRPKNVKSALKYKPDDNDLFVVTFMKSGTTWTQQICTLILSDGEVTSELKEKGLFYVSPFLEMVGAEQVAEVPHPRIIKTHLPFHLKPYNPKSKYIYIARNPKDVLVSLCHHIHLFRDYDFDGTVHDLLPFFIKGDIAYGSYVKHILSWWEHRNDSNVLFLLYEDMKSDIREAVRKIAAFMGDEYKRKLDLNSKILDKIVNRSDLSFMKRTTNKNYEKVWNELGFLKEGREVNFIRKGIIGDWRNELSAEDNKIVEKWFEDSFKNTGVYHLWDKYSVFEHNM